MNKVFLSGYVGSTPEVTNFEDGGRAVSFRLCTSEVWRDGSGNKRTDETWHNIVASNNLADLISKALQKSYHVSFMGKIRNRSYQDTSGSTVHYSEVVVLEIDFDSIKRPKERTDDQPSQAPQNAQNRPMRQQAPPAQAPSKPSQQAPTPQRNEAPSQGSGNQAAPSSDFPDAPIPAHCAYKRLANGDWVVIDLRNS